MPALSEVARIIGNMSNREQLSELQICERCEGSGADPAQWYREDDVRLCIECGGDGCQQVQFDELPLKISA